MLHKKIHYAFDAAANDGEKRATLLEKADDAAWKQLINEYFNKFVVKCFLLTSIKCEQDSKAGKCTNNTNPLLNRAAWNKYTRVVCLTSTRNKRR